MKARAGWIAVSLLGTTLVTSAQQHTIDSQKSVMAVRVFRAGVLSAFGHDHNIAAPIASGSVDTAARRVELRLDAKALRVQDPDTKDRAEIQKTMLGPEVLDVERYPEIAFRSMAIEPAGTGSWKVSGNLTLHGSSQPVNFDVSEKAGHYVGSAVLKQSAFGMKPVKVAGGAVRVKDEVRVEFDIQLAH